MKRAVLLCAMLIAGIASAFPFHPPPPPPVNYGPLFGDVRPKYMVTHVVYAPPGKFSSMTYSQGTTVGSTTSFTQAFSAMTNVKATAGASFPGVGGFSISANTGNTWGTSSQTSESLAVTFTDGYQINGQGDGIDHDEDQVWFVVNPVIHFVVWGPPYYTPETDWSMGGDSRTETYFLYVGELNGHYGFTGGVQTAIQQFGFTAQDFAQLLAADPLNAVPNGGVAGLPGGGRFVFVKQVPYEPPLHSTDTPDKQTYSVTRTHGTQVQSTASTAFTVGVSVSASVDFLKFWSASVAVTDQLTWTNTSSNTDTTSTSSTDALSIAQPSYGYGGPINLNVWEDTVWHTYAFTLDNPQPTYPKVKGKGKIQ